MSTSRQDMQQVSDLMTGDIIALGPTDTVSRAEQILTEFALHMLPIVDRAEVLGAITLADCHGLASTAPLRDVIRRTPVIVDITMPIAEAATLMRAEGIHHLLVTEKIRGTKELVGVLSSLDLLKLLVF